MCVEGQKKEKFMLILIIHFAVFSLSSPCLPLALWYPSSLLSRNLFVVSPQICLSWLNSPSSCVRTVLASIPQSTSPSARDDQTHSQVLTSESAATCMHRGWLWGPGLQVAEVLVEQVSDVLLQILFFAHTVCQRLQSDFLKKCHLQRSCYSNWGKRYNSPMMLEYPAQFWRPRLCCPDASLRYRNVDLGCGAGFRCHFWKTKRQIRTLIIGRRNRRGYFAQFIESKNHTIVWIAQFIESENHRIVELTFKCHLAQFPYNEQGHLH